MEADPECLTLGGKGSDTDYISRAPARHSSILRLSEKCPENATFPSAFSTANAHTHMDPQLEDNSSRTSAARCLTLVHTKRSLPRPGDARWARAGIKPRHVRRRTKVEPPGAGGPLVEDSGSEDVVFRRQPHLDTSSQTQIPAPRVFHRHQPV